MKNPSEEIVTAWLQECKGFFTMSNIKVPKQKGGMGAEIDILGVKGSKKIWWKYQYQLIRDAII